MTPVAGRQVRTGAPCRHLDGGSVRIGPNEAWSGHNGHQAGDRLPARSEADARAVFTAPPVSAMPVEYMTPTIEDRAVPGPAGTGRQGASTAPVDSRLSGLPPLLTVGASCCIWTRTSTSSPASPASQRTPSSLTASAGSVAEGGRRTPPLRAGRIAREGLTHTPWLSSNRSVAVAAEHVRHGARVDRSLR